MKGKDSIDSRRCDRPRSRCHRRRRRRPPCCGRTGKLRRGLHLERKRNRFRHEVARDRDRELQGRQRCSPLAHRPNSHSLRRLRTASPVFIGVARKRDVDAYLADVSRSQIHNLEYSPFSGRLHEPRQGRRPRHGRPRARSGLRRQSGTGDQQLTWRIRRGRLGASS